MLQIGLQSIEIHLLLFIIQWFIPKIQWLFPQGSMLTAAASNGCAQFHFGSDALTFGIGLVDGRLLAFLHQVSAIS